MGRGVATDAVPGNPGAEKGLSVLPLVEPCTTGEGLPYAPEDWPLPGDKWRWRVGRRIHVSGHYHDRFLRPPARLGSSKHYCGKSGWIASKVSVAQFVGDTVPEADLDDFFASFEWKIPSPSVKSDKDIKTSIFSPDSKRFIMNGSLDSRTTMKPRVCKAGNKKCPPRLQARNDALHIMDCDICCSESGFCRDCCCILCGKTTGTIEEGCGFIKCGAIISDRCICGHLAHLNCAFRASLAGTVLGSIGLDAEYYCRRCDNKTNIVPHVKRLLDDCKSVNSRKRVEKALDLGLHILHESKKTEAQKLRCHIEYLILKLRDGVKLEDLWRSENTSQTTIKGKLVARDDITMMDTQNVKQEADGSVDGPESKYLAGSGASHPCKTAKMQSSSEDFTGRDDLTVSLELQNKIERALAELKTAQELEYLHAEKKLYAQKDLLLGMYRELESGGLQLECQTPPQNATKSDTVLTDTESRVRQIMQENSKLDDMMQIAEGFGRTPEFTLKMYFGAHTNNLKQKE